MGRIFHERTLCEWYKQNIADTSARPPVKDLIPVISYGVFVQSMSEKKTNPGSIKKNKSKRKFKSQTKRIWSKLPTSAKKIPTLRAQKNVRPTIQTITCPFLP